MRCTRENPAWRRQTWYEPWLGAALGALVVAAPEGEDFLGGMANDTGVVGGREAIAKMRVEGMDWI